MLYYLVLDFLVSYSDVAAGTYKLVSADDQGRVILSIDFNSQVNVELDNLVAQIDPNVIAPTTAAAFQVGSDINYSLTVGIPDNLTLVTLNNLFSLLTQ